VADFLSLIASANEAGQCMQRRDFNCIVLGVDSKLMAATFTVPGAYIVVPALTKRYRKDRAGLRNLLATHFKRHGSPKGGA